ncbi:hypothetical protein [Streptomyces sp. NPDC047868]|uniref:hypothetical protein n=1 Tax=Streptomyces sp. NPDC047868 TaxID=3155480 RepID=UPI00345155B7
MRRTTTVLLCTAATIALAGCSSGSDREDQKPAAKKPNATTATASPSLSRDETARQCSLAVAEAAPAWEDWSFSPGGWQDDPRTPDVCQGLADVENPPRGNREFMAALLDGLELADDPRADR